MPATIEVVKGVDSTITQTIEYYYLAPASNTGIDLKFRQKADAALNFVTLTEETDEQIRVDVDATALTAGSTHTLTLETYDSQSDDLATIKTD